MLGHFKFCLTIVFGYILFQDKIFSNRIFGIILTFSGVVMYTHLKVKQQEAAKLAAASSSTSSSKTQLHQERV